MKDAIAPPRRPYIRSSKGWWRRNNYYLEYMLHEGTALFVAAYALVLLAGLVCLASGAQAWEGYLRLLKSPVSVVFHLIVLIAVVYHAWSWFRIMPRTLPPVRVKGQRLPGRVITLSGFAAVILVSLFMFFLIWGLAS